MKSIETIDYVQKGVDISDILEQIDKLNKMIELHSRDESNSMIEQYQFMKKEFTSKLNEILVDYKLTITAA